MYNRIHITWKIKNLLSFLKCYTFLTFSVFRMFFLPRCCLRYIHYSLLCTFWKINFRKIERFFKNRELNNF